MSGTTESTKSLLSVDVQYAIQDRKGHEVPNPEQISKWANSAYAGVGETDKEATVRLVDADEMIMLNREFRGKETTTNVLSFGVEVDPAVNISLLGDVVICHSVLVAEAQQQNKSLNHHYAHMITHGILHLCGYDHEHEDDAQQMESLEISLLGGLGISNPYSH